MNRRSIFKLLVGVLPAVMIAKFAAAEPTPAMSYDDEILDGRLPGVIWLPYRNGKMIDGRWYRGDVSDPAPPGTRQCFEIGHAPRHASVRFITVGKSGREYKQCFLSFIDALRMTDRSSEQMAAMGSLWKNLIAAGVPQEKWPLELIALFGDC